jgi:hypothetical protein
MFAGQLLQRNQFSSNKCDIAHINDADAGALARIRAGNRTNDGVSNFRFDRPFINGVLDYVMQNLSIAKPDYEFEDWLFDLNAFAHCYS